MTRPNAPIICLDDLSMNDRINALAEYGGQTVDRTALRIVRSASDEMWVGNQTHSKVMNASHHRRDDWDKRPIDWAYLFGNTSIARNTWWLAMASSEWDNSGLSEEIRGRTIGIFARLLGNSAGNIVAGVSLNPFEAKKYLLPLVG